MKNVYALSVSLSIAIWVSMIVTASSRVAHGAIIIDFDLINAVGVANGVGGAPLNNYLSSFGLTLTNVTAGTQVVVFDQRMIYPGLEPVIAPSPFNVLSQTGSNSAVSFTFQSNQLLTSIGITRPAIRSGVTGVALPLWSMDALSSGGGVLGSVGESNRSIFTDITAQTFTINNPNISAIRFNSNAFNFAAFSSMPLDNLSITAVPEPSSMALFGMAGFIGLGIRISRKLKHRATPVVSSSVVRGEAPAEPRTAVHV